MRQPVLAWLGLLSLALQVLGAMSSPPGTPCGCSNPVVISNTYFAWSSAGKPTTLGQNCTTCNGPDQGAWFKINKSSVARLITLDVCSANGNQPAMLLDVYADTNNMARVASFRTAFGDDTGCRVKFLARAFTQYMVHGWVDPSKPVTVPMTCGKAPLTVSRVPIAAQVYSCQRPMDVNMASWKPMKESQEAPMYSFGRGTSTCSRPEGEGSWAGLPGERDMTYRFFGAKKNMTLTITLETERTWNQGNSPYTVPTFRAFTWQTGICDLDSTELGKLTVGEDVSQYLSQSDNGVSSVLEVKVGPGKTVAVMVTNIGGDDELCGRAQINIWAETGSHQFVVGGSPSD